MSASNELFDKIVVGQLDTSFLDITTRLFPGCLVANGPVYAGLAIGIGVPRATVMIGPPMGIGAPASLEVAGVSNFLGITNQLGVNNRLGLANIFGFTSKLGASIKAAFSATTGVSAKAAVQTTAGPKFCQALAMAPLVKASILEGTPAGPLAVRIDSKKPFDILHPTKDGYRLRHVALEGPAAEVYIRGKLKDSNMIDLPDYWRGLVDAESITVTLTPIGTYQELYYELSDWGTKIKVLNNAGGTIHCSYTVFGERKDTSKNIAEYQGLTPADYPGDNNEYKLN